jgi:deoxyribodipyrimidine photo-lyase
MKTAIVWFRRDLRLTDNPALSAATAECASIIPLYIHQPDEITTWQPGAASRWWLHNSLEKLDLSLQALGSRLVIQTGEIMQVLNRLINKHQVTHLFWNRLYEPTNLERDSEIEQWLKSAGVQYHTFNATLLAEPWQIENKASQPFRVFTPFWRRYGQLLTSIEPPIPSPKKMPPAPRALESIPLQRLKLLPEFNWHQGLATNWNPGESGAFEGLNRFLDSRLTAYDIKRDIPADSGTSRLSPYLHFGEIGPRQILFALQGPEAADMQGRESYLRQLVWREFAQHLLYHFPHTQESPLVAKFKHYPWRRKETSAQLFTAWQRGETGIPIIDAGMRELWQTGWMHNRVRMIVASLLTKNLGIHWLEGARWFWDTLVDADLANNTLGWQWTAGCGADATPFFRIFNPVRQGERFDPDGDYVRRWVPELAALSSRQIHAPWLADQNQLQQAGVELGKDYPKPIVDLKSSREQALSHWKRIK